MNPGLAAYSETVDLRADFWLRDRRVQPSLNRIATPERTIQVEPLVMDVLVHLAGRPAEVVSKASLVEAVWQGRFVSDDVVWRSIRELRRALGDDARTAGFIETIPRRGYRLLAPVSRSPETAPQPSSVPPTAAPAGLPLEPGSIEPAARAGDGTVVVHPRRSPWPAAAAVAALLAIAAAGLWRQIPAAAPAGPPAGAARRIRMAVLPFANLSGDPAEEYFADGLTDEVITRLGSLKPDRLGVVGRTSVMMFKGRGGDVREIGRRLGVDYLLEGSVRRDGERVRVDARLLAAGDRSTMWSERLDLNLWGTLHLQTVVGDRVARALALELLPRERTALGRAAAADPRAHDAYLRGRHLLDRGSAAELREAARAFEAAIAIGPARRAAAPAYAGLADAYHLLAISEALPPAEAYPRAEAAARRALALDPTLAEAHAALAAPLFRYRRRWADAEREYRRALELNPSSARAHQDYAWLLAALGRDAEALAEMRQARELEPLSLRAGADLQAIRRGIPRATPPPS